MTDEQIVKGLECCASGTGCDTCRRCPFYEDKLCDKDRFALEKHLLDLIKRQQAEIESLEADYENVYKQASADILASIADGGTSCEWCIDKHRAEAVREFAKRLTEHSSFCVAKSNGKELYETKAYTIRAKIIDELVREMTEEKK